MFKGFGQDIMTDLPSDVVPISDSTGAEMYYSAEYGELYVPDPTDSADPWKVYAIDDTYGGLQDPTTGGSITDSGSSWLGAISTTIGQILQYSLAKSGIKPVPSGTNLPPKPAGKIPTSYLLIGGGALLLALIMRQRA